MAQINIAGTLHNTEEIQGDALNSHVVAHADEILDSTQGKKQSEINADVQTELGDRYTKEETYSKEQLDDLITTPDVNYVSVVATNATTAVTDILPDTGEANTIYRVGNWNGTQYDPTMYALYAWNGSAYVCLAVRSFVGEVYDVSVNHPDGQGNPTPYADLAAALGTNGKNIPVDIRQGGMRIQFIKGTVQSSDNKYVQYRLTADEFTTDTTQWAIAEEGVYVDNPEFVYVKTDNEGKILWAIKTDGSIYYGAGCPQQVKDYIEEKIAELSLDEYEDIVAFLSDYLGGDTTLKAIIDGINAQIATKVDKVEGKSLVDEEYASTKSTIDSPEFLELTTDAEDKVLEGIQEDGTKVIGGNLNVGGSAKILGEMEVAGVRYKVVENPEYLAAWVDDEYKILFGLKADGKTYVGDADFLDDIKSIKAFLANFNDKNIDWDALTSITTIENPEFVDVKLDTEDKVLEGIKTDGTKVFGGDVEVGGKMSSKKILLNGVELSPTSTVDVSQVIEDPEEKLELLLDAEKKIVSERDKDGRLYENVGVITPVIRTNSLSLTEHGMTEFQQALKDSGFYIPGMNDFSDTKNVEVPEPKHYGIMNWEISTLPTEDGDSIKGYVEYYDFFGNYFKKKCKISPQGQTSLIFSKTGGKGNYTLKIDDAIKSKIKFGEWVPQNSFHMKGCAKDVTRGFLATSYKWAYIIMEALDAKPNRVLMDESSITTTKASGNRITDWPSDARCMPDGFPVEVYINGEYWGLYSLQLQKKSENYSMNKSDYTSFILDADDFGNFWQGTIPWNKFEIRNPEPLICMDGSEYDGDSPMELIDSTSENYDSTNMEHVNSALAKSIIQSFPTKYQAVKDLIEAEDLTNAKALFEEYFDVNACIFVYIYNCLMDNADSVNKNTLWAVYKNGKIVPMLWDIDGVYGEGWIGNAAHAPSDELWEGKYATSNWPLSLLWTLYRDEISLAYANLRRTGKISIDVWKDIVYGWVNRIGTEAYERDIKKWPETPSYRTNYTNTDYWLESGVRDGRGNIPLWDEQTSYNIGDDVAIKLYETNTNWYMIYKATQANINKCPVTKFYSGFPIVGGYFNSPKRMEKWMEEQIRLCDIVMGYNQ